MCQILLIFPSWGLDAVALATFRPVWPSIGVSQLGGRVETINLFHTLALVFWGAILKPSKRLAHLASKLMLEEQKNAHVRICGY